MKPFAWSIRHIAAEPDFENNQVNFNIKYKVENNGSRPATVQIQSTIEGQIFEKPDLVSVEVESGRSIVSVLNFKRSLSDFKLWRHDSPNLYKLTSELKMGGKLADSASDQFGIRKFEARGDNFS